MMASMAQGSGGLQDQMLQLLLALGSAWILYLLLGLSVLSLALALERVLHLAARRGDLAALQPRLAQALAARELAAAAELLAADRSYAARVVGDGLRALPHGPHAVEETLAGASGAARLAMERGIAFLGTLGNNAPFIGLFGTVLGIIRAFRDLSSNTLGGSSAAMAGIAEALVTTAVGLMVALPAVALFNALQRRIRVELARADVLAHVLLAHAKSTGG